MDFKDASVHPIAYFFTKKSRSYEAMKNAWEPQKGKADKKQKMLNDMAKPDRGRKRYNTKKENTSIGLNIRKRSSLCNSIGPNTVIFLNF